MKIFRHLKKGKERGIALVFTLGILGLLTIIALGFASVSMINSKIARNASNTTSAKLIAKAALERILFMGQFYPEKLSAGLYSGDTAKDHYDWLWKLDTAIDGATIYEKFSNAGEDLPPVRWQYVKSKDTDHPDEVIGRFAYEVIADNGRLDPSVHFGKWKEEGTEIPATETGGGKYEGEISMIGAFENISGVDASNAVGDKTKGLCKARYVDNNRRWTDMSEIFQFFADNGKTLSSDEKTQIKEVIDIRKSPDQEAYWEEDEKGNGQVEKSEFYQRFDLNRETQDADYKWDKITVKDLTEARNKSDDSEEKLASPLPFDRKKNFNFMGPIPWLQYWQDKANWTDASLVKQQIAANLIQYNLPETSATVTEEYATGTSTEKKNTAPDSIQYFFDNYAANKERIPKIYGVGRHPMLNEIGFKFSALVTSEEQSYLGGLYTKCTVTNNCSFAFGGELIDIFGIPKGEFKDSKIYLFGSLSFQYPVVYKEGASIKVKDTDNTFIPTTDNPWVIDLTKENWYPEGTCKSYAGKWLDTDIDVIDKLGITRQISQNGFSFGEISSKLTLKNVVFHLAYAVLTYKNGASDAEVIRDVVCFNKDFKFFESGVNIANNEVRIAAALEANDPRVNNFASDWDCENSAKLLTGGSSLTYPGTLGSVNETISDLKTLGDGDDVTDPAFSTTSRLSTAYVRHAPMQSLWELGCISRAEKWCTLNLTKKKVFENSVAANLRGGGTYADGDANLLDQVKLRKDNEIYGKVNLNSSSHKVLEALLQYKQITGLKESDRGLNSYYDLSQQESKKTAAAVPAKVVSTSHTIGSNANCLVCQIYNRSKLLSFKNRSDLLMTGTDMAKLVTNKELKTSSSNLETAMTNLHTGLLNPGSSDSTTKAEKEQLICKFINLAKAEQTEQLYVIILAQSIKDTGPLGTTVYADWDNDGSSKSSNPLPDSNISGWKKLGYVRKPRNETEAVSNAQGKVLSRKVARPEEMTDSDWGYQNGIDKITGETKMIVVLQKDAATQKWRIVRYEYGE